MSQAIAEPARLSRPTARSRRIRAISWLIATRADALLLEPHQHAARRDVVPGALARSTRHQTNPSQARQRNARDDEPQHRARPRQRVAVRIDDAKPPRAHADRLPAARPRNHEISRRDASSPARSPSRHASVGCAGSTRRARRAAQARPSASTARSAETVVDRGGEAQPERGGRRSHEAESGDGD